MRETKMLISPNVGKHEMGAIMFIWNISSL